MLPLLHHVLLKYSKLVTKYIHSSGIEVSWRPRPPLAAVPQPPCPSPSRAPAHQTQRQLTLEPAAVHAWPSQLQGKTDQRFVEHAFKLFRDVMGLKPVITPTQFLDTGFAERKVCARRGARRHWGGGPK